MSVLVGDCASDPPLGATARTLAVRFADELVYGLGLVALARDGAKPSTLSLLARHDDAEAALRAAVERAQATVQVERVPDAWPAPASGERFDAAVLLAVADAARGRAERCFVTVAGAVEAPLVVECAPELPVEALVDRAGGARDADWVPVAGGAPGGRLVERSARAVEVGSTLLVLPARHEVVRRLRTPIADWLQRAASTCEGCRICSDSCPEDARPHDVLWTLVSGRDDGVALASTPSCTGCGLCDAQCPSALSPRRLVVEVRDRLGLAPASALGRSSGLDLELLTMRLGLAPYAGLPSLL